MLILTWKRLVIPGAPHRTGAIKEGGLLQHHGVLLLGVHGVRLRLQLLHGRLQLLRVIVHAIALLGDLRRPLLQRHHIRLHPAPPASVHALSRTADATPSTSLKLRPLSHAMNGAIERNSQAVDVQQPITGLSHNTTSADTQSGAKMKRCFPQVTRQNCSTKDFIFLREMVYARIRHYARGGCTLARTSLCFPHAPNCALASQPPVRPRPPRPPFPRGVLATSP